MVRLEKSGNFEFSCQNQIINGTFHIMLFQTSHKERIGPNFVESSLFHIKVYKKNPLILIYFQLILLGLGDPILPSFIAVMADQSKQGFILIIRKSRN